ncbi:unnamed protein product [Lymnaea stagnalis]|uniref:CUB domain-containing protein n=1 Tax=Lymnaea stagnalis TaxID=6523 RepID=A0AAV2I0K5_LYMST
MVTHQVANAKSRVLVAFLILNAMLQAVADIPTYYLGDFCSLTLDMEQARISAGRLLLRRPGQQMNSLNCDVIIRAPANKKITFRFHRFDVHPGQGCFSNYIRLFDDATFKIPLTDQLCNDAVPKKAYKSTTELAGIKVDKELFVRDQIELLFTAFTYAPCTGSEYSCKNGHCIAGELYCNGFDNCGDSSDICILRAGTVLAIIIGVSVVVALLGIGLGVYLFRRQRRIRRERVSG